MNEKPPSSFQGKTGLKLSSRRGRKRRKQRIRTLLLLSSAGLFIAALVMIVNYVSMTRQTVRTQQELQAAYHQTQEPQMTAAALAPLPIVSYSPPPAAAVETPRPVSATQIPSSMCRRR